jgi:hypothetical protein
MDSRRFDTPTPRYTQQARSLNARSCLRRADMWGCRADPVGSGARATYRPGRRVLPCEHESELHGLVRSQLGRFDGAAAGRRPRPSCPDLLGSAPGMAGGPPVPPASIGPEAVDADSACRSLPRNCFRGARPPQRRYSRLSPDSNHPSPIIGSLVRSSPATVAMVAPARTQETRRALPLADPQFGVRGLTPDDAAALASSQLVKLAAGDMVS